jgi:hypothetical protein
MTEITNDDMNAISTGIWGAVRVAGVLAQLGSEIERAPDGVNWQLADEAGERFSYFSDHLLKSRRELQDLYDKAIKPPKA